MTEKPLSHTKQLIAASTVSLGAIVTPAAAQSHFPEHQARQKETYQMQAAKPSAGQNGGSLVDSCGNIVVAGGVLAAGGYLALKRNPKKTRQMLEDDDQKAREWGRYNDPRGSRNRDI